MQIKPSLNSLCVDASCIGNPGVMEYKIVNTKDKKIIYESPKFPEGTNNLGEFLAIVDALKYLRKKGDEKTIIYSDSNVAIARAKSKKIKTALPYSEKTKTLLTKIQDSVIRTKTHNYKNKILKRETEIRGEIPADYGRK